MRDLLGHPYDLLWLLGEHRILFHDRVDRPELEVFVDASGFPVVESDAPLLADTASLVARFREGVERPGGAEADVDPVTAAARAR